MRRVEINWKLAYPLREKESGFFQGYGLKQSPDKASHHVVTCAIVELYSGRIKMVDPELIVFLEPPVPADG